eukprot:scaffold22929_cov32-Tisochrysis_lutea.AAC.2
MYGHPASRTAVEPRKIVSSVARSKLLTSAAAYMSMNCAARRQKISAPHTRHLRCTSERRSGADSNSFLLKRTTSSSIVSCCGDPPMSEAPLIGMNVIGTLGADRGRMMPSKEYQYKSLPHQRYSKRDLALSKRNASSGRASMPIDSADLLRLFLE